MYRLDSICFEAPFRFSLPAIRRFAEAPGALTVVAEALDGSCAGFAIGERIDKVLYLVTLDVDPAMRRQGVARTMLRWLEGHAPAVQWIALHVFQENQTAISFYEWEGFVLIGRETDFYGRGLHALQYRRAVRKS